MNVTVTMNFGDGTFKLIEMEGDYDSPEEASDAAKIWVSDNAWFEVDDDTWLEAVGQGQ